LELRWPSHGTWAGATSTAQAGAAGPKERGRSRPRTTQLLGSDFAMLLPCKQFLHSLARDMRTLCRTPDFTSLKLGVAVAEQKGREPRLDRRCGSRSEGPDTLFKKP